MLPSPDGLIFIRVLDSLRWKVTRETIPRKVPTVHLAYKNTYLAHLFYCSTILGLLVLVRSWCLIYYKSMKRNAFFFCTNRAKAGRGLAQSLPDTKSRGFPTPDSNCLRTKTTVLPRFRTLSKIKLNSSRSLNLILAGKKTIKKQKLKLEKLKCWEVDSSLKWTCLAGNWEGSDHQRCPRISATLYW